MCSVYVKNLRTLKNLQDNSMIPNLSKSQCRLQVLFLSAFIRSLFLVCYAYYFSAFLLAFLVCVCIVSPSV